MRNLVVLDLDGVILDVSRRVENILSKYSVSSIDDRIDKWYEGEGKEKAVINYAFLDKLKDDLKNYKNYKIVILTGNYFKDEEYEDYVKRILDKIFPSYLLISKSEEGKAYPTLVWKRMILKDFIKKGNKIIYIASDIEAETDLLGEELKNKEVFSYEARNGSIINIYIRKL